MNHQAEWPVGSLPLGESQSSLRIQTLGSVSLGEDPTQGVWLGPESQAPTCSLPPLEL